MEKIYYNYVGLMDAGFETEFIDFLNGVSYDKRITMFLTSHGGNHVTTQKLTHIINNDVRIDKVIFNWTISSSAFYLMTNISPKKRIIAEDCYSVVHIWSRDIPYRDALNRQKIELFMKEDLEESNRLLFEHYRKIGFTEEEIEIMKTGENVYLNNRRLKEIFKVEGV